MRIIEQTSRLLVPVAVLLAGARLAAADPPLALHPNNPHYFLFRGKPAVLVGSTEHYGAVLNPDFDYLPYLDELHAQGLNLTRTFTGVYCESPGAFNIAKNTLAPAPGRLVCPWARSAEPGYANGGNKFDLGQWDEAYLKRLKSFLTEAGKRGIVVELVLFCPYYEDAMWQLSPLNARNNVNGVGKVARTDALTLKDKPLLAVQEALVRKLTAELRDFDNLYYEVCNEPYFGGVTLEWQHRIVDILVDAEKAFPQRHLIAQNIANGAKQVEKPHPAVSLFNFHYATPPDTVALNFSLHKALGDDETGFRGTSDAVYRKEGWDFLLAGGAVYDHLDYSFAVGHEKGTFRYPARQPGGGSPELRQQLRILKDFVHRFDFIKMKPDNSVIKGGTLTAPLAAGKTPEAKVTARALVEAGRAYAVYLNGGTQAELVLELPASPYQAEWINTKTGKLDKAEEVAHAGGMKKLISPPYTEDIALRVKRKSDS